MIVATEVECIHGSLGQRRMIFYRCQDHLGQWHNYGPMVTTDDNFDVDGFKAVVAEKVANQLAEAEFNRIIGEV